MGVEIIDQSVQSLLFGMSLCLQLFFRVSERALWALLKFLCLFVAHLSSLSPSSSLLQKLCKSFPKSASFIHKVLSGENGISEYVVCPRCSKLSNCVIKVGSQDQSLKCDFIEYPNHPHLSRRGKCNTTLLKTVSVGRKRK